MRKIRRNGVIGATLIAFALIAAACGSGDDSSSDETTAAADTTVATETTAAGGGGDPIIVGSANFSESALVAEIYAQALEAEGFTIDRKLNTGTREIYKPALESGELDLVPEYIGTMLQFLGGTPTADSATTHSDLAEAWAPAGIAVLDYASAQDKNGFVVTAETASEFGFESVSDLAAENGNLILGGPPECPEREFCLQGLEDVYGLSFAEFKPLDVGGPLTVAALEGDEVQVGLLFTSDGVIKAKDFVLLADDKGLQPAENLVPAIRQDVLDSHSGSLASALNAVSAKLTTPELIVLNARVGFDGEDPDKVAADWLAANGLS
jgi:osmoprotectant transport system substrate-binding protein